MKNKRLLRFIAIFLLLNITLEISYPSVAYALTAGPSSPEFSKFQSVATSDMVNTFTGDFSYNLPVVEIPGPDGAGYALSLSYQNGVSSEEEASWVGFGWTLNPGSINRNTRGFPDDFDGQAIKRYNKMRSNTTTTGTNSAAMEFFSSNNAKSSAEKSQGNGSNQDGEGYQLGSAGLNVSVGFSNYSGYRFSMGISGGWNLFANKNKYKNFGGVLGGGIQMDQTGRAAFNPNISLSIGLSEGRGGNKEAADRIEAKKSVKWADKVRFAHIGGGRSIGMSTGLSVSSMYGLFTFSGNNYNTSLNKTNRTMVNISGGMMIPLSNLNFGMQFGFAGSISTERSESFEELKMHGYMNNINGLNSQILTDYYLERGTSFDKRDKYLGIPFNNADNFSVSGEGIGGGFRYYPNSIGHFYPINIENDNLIYTLGIDFNLGGNAGVGVDLGLGFSKSSIGNWGNIGNTASQRFDNNGFFRFNGDLGGEVSYADSELWNARLLRNFIFPEPNIGTDKFELNEKSKNRTSFISYNSYRNAKGGTVFNKQHIYNRTNSIRDSTIAEISIHNSSGMQYIYGQPVYTRNETNLNFGVKPGKFKPDEEVINRYLAYKNSIKLPLKSANLEDDYDVNHSLSQHNYIVGDIKPAAFANSFLLTQIYSNDYVDLGAPGCSTEDFGSWTQFSYFKRYGNKTGWQNNQDCLQQVTTMPVNVNNEWYRWRTPYNGLFYNQNSISDTKDDLGSVSTGQKEVLYLKSIETKTHIAFFVTNKSSVNKWKDELSKIDWSFFIDRIRNSDITLPCGRVFDPNTKTWIYQSDCVENIINSCRTFDSKKNQYVYNWECLNGYFGNFLNQYLTGSCQDRKDGLGAKNLTNEEDPMAKDASQKGNTQLEYLEKIVLFSKARMEKPLKVTHFAYDYSLVRNLPNNINGNYPNARTNDQSGKLTLKKVWFEYEGTTSTKTSPYEFTYKYKDKTTFPEYLKNKYPNFVLMNQNLSDKAQNPDYDPHLLDIWSNVQPYGKERSSMGINWRYQGTEFANADNLGGWRSLINNNTQHEYDPAAWHLKQIKLPSGGEILVEYEEKDYEFVQNRGVMAMTSLLRTDENDYKTGSYVINMKDLGIDPNNTQEVQQQFQKIQEYFNKETKVKFKFLYKLLGDGIPHLDDCRSDYVEGYAHVDKVELINNNKEIRLKLGNQSSNSGSRGTAPRQACWEFYTSQRIGRLQGGGKNCDDAVQSQEIAGSTIAMIMQANPSGIVGNFLGNIATLSQHLPQGQYVGLNINPSMSFLRLPMIKKKKGGGSRVKRLLMFDAGIETGDANLYGQEYFYEKGVATNEPPGSRDENPLVNLLDKQVRGGFENGYDKLTVGEDKEQIEGPLGESLLPGASIGYSKVIVENIHKGETGTGYTIQEFYTVADYPFDKDYSVNSYSPNTSDFSLQNKQVIPSISNTNLYGDNRIESKLPIPLNISAKMGVISLSMSLNTSSVYASQGYRFIINSMHGQTKKVGTYRGSYSNQDQSKLISSQEYFYYEPGEKIKILKYIKSNNSYILDLALPGKESDMSMDMRMVKEQTTDISLSVDFGIGLAPLPPPVFSAALGMNYSDSNIGTHTVSKVIRYPVIVKKIESIQEGIKSVTENLAFSAETGQCLVTRTFDGYHDIQKNNTQKHDGSIYSLTLPAFWYYPEMGQKAVNTSNQNLLSTSAGSVVSYGEEGNPLRAIQGQPNVLALPLIKNVSQAQVQTYAKDWFKRSNIKEQLREEYNISNQQEKALNNVYRPLANYVFKSDVSSANSSGGKIYKDGLIPQINMFTAWDGNGVSSEWLLGSMVTEYSPNGQPLEETNALDIPSSARFGYKNMVPSMVAANAKYTNIFFEDFENMNISTNFSIITNIFHSGRKSLKINNSGQLLMSKIYNNERLRTNKLDFNKGGAVVKMWVNSAETNNLRVYLEENGQNYPCDVIAKIGNWTLIESNIPSSAFDSMLLNQKFNVYIKSISGILDNILVDDVKFQPKNAQATCYVYDVATLKLLAQFDDQHFGMFFQYDAEGKLTRKMVETIKGISTVTESQYNTPKRK